MFRQARSVLCLDEPFNPTLRCLPQDHPKQVWSEYLDRFHRNPAEFQARFAPITPRDELSPLFREAQLAYLDWLIDTHECVFLDTTRCQFKLETLHQRYPTAIVIHLYRSPENFASSHLLPRRSARRIQDRIHTFRDKRDFFARRARYNNWGMEEIVDSIPSSQWSEQLTEIGLSPQDLPDTLAVVKLMAYWWMVYREVEATGRRLFGSRFVSLPLGHFCDHPVETISQLFQMANVPSNAIDATGVRSESLPFRANCERWHEWRQHLGIPLDLIPHAAASC